MRNLVRIEVTDDQLMQISRKLFLTHYVHNKSPTLNIARWAVFRKRKKPPQPPKNQPPTECNALIQVLSVHGQCQLWKGPDKPYPPIVDMEPCPWLGDEGRSNNASHLCSTNCPPPKASCYGKLPMWSTDQHDCTTGRCCFPMH